MARNMAINGPTLSQPEWTNDTLHPHDLVVGGIQLDPTGFLATDAARVTLTANAAQGATAIAFTALTNPIPSGTVLYFGGAKVAVTAAAAATGATGVVVAALPTALVSGDTTVYAGSGMQPRAVPSGTTVGRTYAQRDAGTGFHTAADSDEEFVITATRCLDVTHNAWTSAVRPQAGVTIKEDYLPGWSALSATVKAAVRARYVTMRSDTTS